jgi:hypothetical protein
MAERKFYEQVVTVIDRTLPFADLEQYDCFTLPTTTGFGNIWIGFNIWLKISEKCGVNLQNGQHKTFEELDTVLNCRLSDPAPKRATA